MPAKPNGSHVTCPACQARPGQPCVTITKPPRIMPINHVSRVRKAKAIARRRARYRARIAGQDEA